MGRDSDARWADTAPSPPAVLSFLIGLMESLPAMPLESPLPFEVCDHSHPNVPTMKGHSVIQCATFRSALNYGVLVSEDGETNRCSSRTTCCCF
jgi:hypothetical protein